MNELELLRSIQKRVPTRDRRLVLGIGDDCAIYRPDGRAEDLLFTTDLMIEDVHFRRRTYPAEAIGWKTLARGLSDIAAMGGEPRFCLLSLAAAPWVDEQWVNGFYRGFLRLADKARVTLAGGDLAHSGRTACDVVVCGATPRGKALRRDGARAGDRIYVSGKLGASALGLKTRRGAAWKRHLKPEPRLSLGLFLRRLGATACIDSSDGLSLDLHFTVPKRAAVPPAFDRLPLTPIGTIRRGRPGLVELDGCPLPPRGYDHFRKP
jgi:thiamine-monophosphate kinase